MLEFNSTNNDDCGCDSGSLNGFTDPSCPAPSVVTWNSIQGKPSCFTPCPHTHVPGDIIGLEAYIQSVQYVGNITTTNSIQLTAPSGFLNANLRLSANAGVGYKVPLSILSDGLIGQIPYASGSNAGILSAADWTTFNNKFNTPSGTVFQYVRGDGSLATFPTFGTLSSVGITMPAAFGVVNSPLTSNGTITINALGSTAQYIRGDGTLATFPTIPSLPSFLVGSVPFGNGTGLTENNTKFFWDNTAFKLKLTDSKLELLNTGTFGSALLEYKLVNSLAMLVYDQTTSNDNFNAYLKLRCFNNEGTASQGQITGLLFDLVDPTITFPQTSENIGLIWNTPRKTGSAATNNLLILKNNYNTTGKINIEASKYVSVDGIALRKAQVYNFNNTTNFEAIITLPNNTLRFTYGGPGAVQSIKLPYDVSIGGMPDGYIVILKATNARGIFPTITVDTSTGLHTLDAYTFTADFAAVTYRFDATSNHWDLIAKN